MKYVKILVRTIGLEFYKKHIALFVIFLYVAFGILTAKEHRMFAQMVNHSSILFISLLVIWSLYCYSVVRFCLKQFQVKQNRFLQNIIYLPAFQLLFISILLSSLLAPITLYSIFLACQDMSFINGLIMLFYISLVHVIPSIIIKNRLKHPNSELRSVIYKSISLGSHILLWPFSYLINQKALTLIVIKVISGGIIFLTGAWDQEYFDLRWWGLGILFSGIASIFLILDISTFYKSQKNLLNQQPLSNLKQLYLVIGIVLLLCFPDIILLLRHFNYDRGVGTVILIALLYIAMILFPFIYVIQNTLELEKHLNLLFFYSVLLFALILFNFPVIILILLLYGAALFLQVRSNFFIK